MRIKRDSTIEKQVHFLAFSMCNAHKRHLHYLHMGIIIQQRCFHLANQIQ